MIDKNQLYTQSIMCISSVAELIYVHKDDFLVLRKNEKLWNAIHENIDERNDNMAKKFKEQAAADKFMANTFAKLSGLPTNKKKFTAGDNLLKQKMAFDKMVEKHDAREKMLAEDSETRDNSIDKTGSSFLNQSLSQIP